MRPYSGLYWAALGKSRLGSQPWEEKRERILEAGEEGLALVST